MIDWRRQVFLDYMGTNLLTKLHRHDSKCRINIMRVVHDTTGKLSFKIFDRYGFDHADSDYHLTLNPDQGVAGLACALQRWVIGIPEHDRVHYFEDDGRGNRKLITEGNPHRNLRPDQLKQVRHLNLIYSFPIKRIIRREGGIYYRQPGVIAVLNIDTQMDNALVSHFMTRVNDNADAVFIDALNTSLMDHILYTFDRVSDYVGAAFSADWEKKGVSSR